MKNPFPKEEKLRKKKEFMALFKNGKVYSGGVIQLFVIRRQDNLKKVGFVLNRRIKSVVQRNRLRRILREIYRLHRRIIKGGYSFLIKINTSSVNEDLSSLEAEFLNLAGQAGIMKWQNVSRETFLG